MDFDALAIAQSAFSPDLQVYRVASPFFDRKPWQDTSCAFQMLGLASDCAYMSDLPVYRP